MSSHQRISGFENGQVHNSGELTWAEVRAFAIAMTSGLGMHKNIIQNRETEKKNSLQQCCDEIAWPLQGDRTQNHQSWFI